MAICEKHFHNIICVICLKVCMKSLVVYVYNTINKSIKYINTYLISTFVFICKKGHNFGLSCFDNCLSHPQKCIFRIKSCRCTFYCFIMSIAIFIALQSCVTALPLEHVIFVNSNFKSERFNRWNSVTIWKPISLKLKGHCPTCIVFYHELAASCHTLALVLGSYE